MIQCIYCKEYRAGDCFSNTEHVIPEAFGKFRNNLTLNGIVCNDCNRIFGETIDLFLARDSYEGRLRFQHGLKLPREFKSLGRRTEMVPTIQEGQFKNAFVKVEYEPIMDQIVMNPLPQIGFMHAATGDYEYHLIDDIPTKESLRRRGYAMPNQQRGIIILACNEAEANQILEERGFELTPKEEIPIVPQPGDTALVRFQGSLLQNIMRGLSKICFNYAAYVLGPEFLLHKDFDHLRRYVHNGDRPPYLFFTISPDAIAKDEQRSPLRRLGHIVTLSWSDNKQAVLADLSLFNSVHYTISLSKFYGGVYREIRKGHFFNIGDRTIHELTPFSRGLAL